MSPHTRRSSMQEWGKVGDQGTAAPQVVVWPGGGPGRGDGVYGWGPRQGGWRLGVAGIPGAGGHTRPQWLTDMHTGTYLRVFATHAFRQWRAAADGRGPLGQDYRWRVKQQIPISPPPHCANLCIRTSADRYSAWWPLAVLVPEVYQQLGLKTHQTEFLALVQMLKTEMMAMLWRSKHQFGRHKL